MPMKFAQLLSTIGAGVLGVGLGLLLPNDLATYGLPILVLGTVCHLVGMWRKHNLESVLSVTVPVWQSLLYWGCWLALLLLLASLLWHAIEGSVPA